MNRMDQIRLLNSTGNRDVDRVLGAVIGTFETAFPGRPRAYYLFGSYADQSEVGLSDIDLLIVFAGAFDAGEQQRAGELQYYCQMLTELRLEVTVRSHEQLTGDVELVVPLKMGAVLIYGEDIREEFDLPAFGEYTWFVTSNLHRFLLGVLRGQDRAGFPLDFPDPQHEFFGYAEEEILDWHPHFMHGGGTQGLVASAGWAAMAVVALCARRFAGSKREAFRLYKECIGDEWAGFLGELFDNCKTRWGYLVPADPADREHLRDICRRMLDFENHVLAVYRMHLLEEIRSRDQSRLTLAVKRLGEIIYPDGELVVELAALEDKGDAHLRRAVRETLQVVEYVRRAYTAHS